MKPYKLPNIAICTCEPNSTWRVNVLESAQRSDLIYYGTDSKIQWLGFILRLYVRFHLRLITAFNQVVYAKMIQNQNYFCHNNTNWRNTLSVNIYISLTNSSTNY